MYALTRVLQHQLGITALSDSFGPTTLAELQRKYPTVDQSCRVAAMVQIVQSALYCKGYKGGQVDGVFDAETVDGASSMKRDMGVAGAYPGAGITPKVFKALLTMDAYVVVGSGTAQVRSIQQWMNARYLPRPPHDSMGTHVRFIDQPRVPRTPSPRSSGNADSRRLGLLRACRESAFPRGVGFGGREGKGQALPSLTSTVWAVPPSRT